MLNIFKNVGRTIMVLVSTFIQFIALILNVICLVFEAVVWFFRTGNILLMNTSARMLTKAGFMKK